MGKTAPLPATSVRGAGEVEVGREEGGWGEEGPPSAHGPRSSGWTWGHSVGDHAQVAPTELASVAVLAPAPCLWSCLQG